MAPFAAALLAAVCFGVASVLQHSSANRAESGTALDPRLLVRLGCQGPYLAGLGLDVVGFALSTWAVRLLPLFVVQAALASSLAVTSVVAALTSRESLRRTERNAVVAIVSGLVLLAVSAAPEQAPPARGVMTGALLVGLPLLVLTAALVERRPTASRSGVALAALAGLAFAGFGMTGRVLAAPPRLPLLADPLSWALVVYVGLGLLFFATALQRGTVTTITGACIVVETLAPAVVGVLVLGDGARPGLDGLALAGFVLTIGAALSLARAGESPRRPPTPPAGVHRRSNVGVAD